MGFFPDSEGIQRPDEQFNIEDFKGPDGKVDYSRVPAEIRDRVQSRMSAFDAAFDENKGDHVAQLRAVSKETAKLIIEMLEKLGPDKTFKMVESMPEPSKTSIFVALCLLVAEFGGLD